MSTLVTTIKQMARHAGKSPLSVRRGLEKAGKLPKPEPGERGLRIELQTANAFLQRHWPGTPKITPEVLAELATETDPKQ